MAAPQRPSNGNIMKQMMEQKIENEENSVPQVNAPVTAPDSLISKSARTVKSSLDKGKSVFKGFTHKLKATHKVSTFLPVTNVEVRLTPILFEEEVAMAQSLVNPSDVLMEMVKTIYSHIVEGPVEITSSFDSFIDHVCEPDLTALVYGLYLTSYGSKFKPDTVICKTCEDKHELPELNLADLYKEVPFEGDAFSALKHRTSLDMADYDLPGVVFNVKIPVLRNTLATETNDIKTASISRIEKYIENVTTTDENGVSEVYTDNESLHNAVSTLPPMAREHLLEILDRDYFKYGVTFEHEWKCSHVIDDDKVLGGKRKCDTVNTFKPSVEDLFFRKVYDALLGTTRSK